MVTAEPGRTSRQQKTGAALRAETKRRLSDAAAAEFAERGYHAATVSRIAARAGVTVQTLYLAWGSKRALLSGYLDAALAGDTEQPYAEALPRLLSDTLDSAGSDPHEIIVHFARLYRGVVERAALGWRLYQDAAAADPQIAADWQQLQRLRRRTVAEVVGRIPVTALRAGTTAESATDTAWVIASPETHELLVGTAGYTLDDYEAWVVRTLSAALLAL